MELDLSWARRALAAMNPSVQGEISELRASKVPESRILVLYPADLSAYRHLLLSSFDTSEAMFQLLNRFGQLDSYCSASASVRGSGRTGH